MHALKFARGAVKGLEGAGESVGMGVGDLEYI